MRILTKGISHCFRLLAVDGHPSGLLIEVVSADQAPRRDTFALSLTSLGCLPPFPFCICSFRGFTWIDQEKVNLPILCSSRQRLQGSGQPLRVEAPSEDRVSFSLIHDWISLSSTWFNRFIISPSY